MLIEVLAGSALAVLLLFGLVTVTVIRVSRERVTRAWAETESAMNARVAVAARIAAAVEAYAGTGPEVEQLAAGAAAALAAPVAVREDAEQRLVATLRRVFKLVAQYPELQGDPTYRHLQGRLDEAQIQIDRSLATYDRCARRLNHRVVSRPLRPAAAVLRCAVAPAFDAGDPGAAT